MTHDNVTDIVERLRGYGKDQHSWRSQAERKAAALIEAQDEAIATLRKQLENAREALRQCRNAVKGGIVILTDMLMQRDGVHYQPRLVSEEWRENYD